MGLGGVGLYSSSSSSAVFVFDHYSFSHFKFNHLTSTVNHLAPKSFSAYTPSTKPLLTVTPKPRTAMTLPSAALFSQNPVVSDVVATALSGSVALFFLQLWKETATRGIFDQKLNRKLVHISIGITFMLCWPLFSPGSRGAWLAATIPGVNIIRMLVLGLGLWKDEATVKSMSRFGDYRELLKGPLYYVVAITLACIIYWRTSPISIVAICNLCAGDGVADIVGRRFGSIKIPYNKNKSIAGSIAMVSASFLASVGFMYYFSLFGYMERSWEMVLKFWIVALASALVESLPISTDLDDNLTVPATSILVGSLIFYFHQSL